MESTDALTIITIILTMAATTYGAARFVLLARQRQSELTQEIARLKMRLDLVSSTLREDLVRFHAVQEISSSAQIAIDADLHSISVPVPRGNATHLKIIVSTDKQAGRIIGKEFPISMGLAGRVYNNQHAEFVNRALDDPIHFKVVDEAAGTRTGEGSIISYPLITAKRCVGVAQFMRNPGRSPFTREDLMIVGRFAERITAKLAELEESGKDDPRVGAVPEVFASVLFTDINDYSKVAQNISLYQAVYILDDYYRRMLDVSQAFGAAFEEYVGDGVYLSFQGKTRSEATRSAIMCALGMQRAFEVLRKEWIAFQYPLSENNYHNIGIASGHVFEGTVGHAQHRRRKLIGSTINTAAHLAEFGKTFGGCIIIDKTTRDSASPIGVVCEVVDRHKYPECYLVTDTGPDVAV